MRQTLFYLPHEWMGIPVLGVGWLLGILTLIAFLFAVIAWRKNELGKFIQEQGILIGVAACVVVFLLPQIETRISDGTPGGWIAGLPVRGYGVMLMLGVISAIAIAMYRCAKAGVQQDAFFSLATWVIACGLIGARLFYVIQKWSELEGATFFEKLVTALKVTEGGLVVYGSVIGGLIGAVIWATRNKQSLLPIADAVTPAFFIGLAFGRVGCLLNGCCYGGVCPDSLPCIEFPSGAPAYMDQLSSGRLLGMVTQQSEGSGNSPITKVQPHSWAANQNIQPGEKLRQVVEIQVNGPDATDPYRHPEFAATVETNRGQFHVDAQDVPKYSLPVHPSQLYAALGAFLLCGWTLLLAETTRGTGIVFGAGWVTYGVLRILEEYIRVDEAGQFGTSLSIAQWISVLGIFFGIFLLVRARMSKNMPNPG